MFLILSCFDTFLVHGRRMADGGNTDNRANSVQLQMQLTAGTELGNWREKMKRKKSGRGGNFFSSLFI